MANIKFERDGVEKVADESFTEALESVGWKAVEDKPKKKATRKKKDD